ncbi:uncharacterized protein MYCGRDRAFT_93740 [Zymoseptoria tritici IPO323]|uniref:Uncharacterized protein n=1 Tax=Zymoseptoria tritici (strain CBS 115943 / IPO323) TaxID=336722 RepID=F9XCV6_ZYMTI|nr:uncharacterized protein MYCGRDRAFT_93740 [Zymoseptoria tritici IPO323]EGP86377.1 hypothetical protein MYCGRDRAFT_93740 [Zymoseptoria tritici IPO323]
MRMAYDDATDISERRDDEEQPFLHHHKGSPYPTEPFLGMKQGRDCWWSVSGLRSGILRLSDMLASPLLTHGLVFVMAFLFSLAATYFVMFKATAPCSTDLASGHTHHNAERPPSIRPQWPTPPMHGNFSLKAKLTTCGHSTPEAKELGCRYDILSNHWIPGACMDEEAVVEYQADNSWYGFADPAHTKLLTIEEMSEQDFYYTNERDHIVHCAMLWRKQFRAFYEERPNIDALIANVEHTCTVLNFSSICQKEGQTIGACQSRRSWDTRAAG